MTQKRAWYRDVHSSIPSSFAKMNWWKRQNQKCRAQTTESGRGNNFRLDVIGKSSITTLNVEHGWSSACWRYLVYLKPPLPALPLSLDCPRLIPWSIFLKQQAASLLISQTQPTSSSLPFWPPEKKNAVLQFKHASPDPRIKRRLTGVPRNVAKLA